MSALLILLCIVVVSTLVHESGHALAALAVGWRIDGVTLRWYGVFLRVECPDDDPSASALAKVAAGGLMATALLAALCYLLAPLGIIFWMLCALNVLFCFNLIPLPVSDGGYLWRALR